MITYDRECELMDKLIRLSCSLSGDVELIKEASIVNTLTGVASGLKDRVMQRVKDEGVMGALATYMSPTVLFALPAPLNIIGLILMAAGAVLGVSPGSLFNKAYEMAKQVISSKGKLTSSDAKAIADASVAGLGATASFAALDTLDKQGKMIDALSGTMIKDAQLFGRRRRYSGSKGIMGTIYNLFSSVTGGARKALASGFFRWAILGVLSGIAAFEGVPMVWNAITGGGISSKPETGSVTAPTNTETVSLISGNQFSPDSTDTSQPPQKTTTSYNLPSGKGNTLKPAPGVGTRHFNNEHPNYWMARINNRSIVETLLGWTVAIYPELRNHVDVVAGLRSFNKVVSEMNRNYDAANSPDYLIVLPDSGLHSWKEIVDLFAGDAEQIIKRKQ